MRGPAAVDPPVEATPTTPAVWRLRELAVCVVLTALAFLQSPGKIVPDSKIDLALNPSGWLERALHLWEPAGAFGQLQNQAYGYLWPMGPFFAAGSGLGIPAWGVQRLWWALIMCVAFLGMVRLAAALGIGTPASRLLGGVVFALTPRFLTEMGAHSVEVWPSAVAPWVVLPLIGLAKGASLRRSVALSALAVATAGGVNATAVFAVVPLAVLWLLTLEPMRRRLVALAAWTAATLCATAWWLVPLFVLGVYSPPFLDFIENAAATTGVTDSVTNLRGASHWVAYLSDAFGPSLPAGWRLATEAVPLIGAVVLAALGLAGLARPGMPGRRFLVAGLLVGMALLGLGHVTDLPGTFGQGQRQFLDGIGAPLRNVHKFDVVIRVPLVLGLVHLIGIFSRAGAVRRPGFRYAPAPTAVVTLSALTALAAVSVVAMPGLSRGLAPARGFTAVPAYWDQAADWLDQRLGQDRVLVIPGARFPNYTWGSTLDELTQPLLSSAWAVRNAIPLTPPGTIRLLDTVESALATGAGSPGLADLLARSGVRFLLVRSDLDYGRSGSVQPIIVRQALARSPGLEMVAGFGPDIDAAISVFGFMDRGLGIRTRALEVYEVKRPVASVVAYDTADVRTVVGGPESLLDLAATGELTEAPTVLAGDLPPDVTMGPVTMTDGMRRRDVSFGRGRDNVSATLTYNEAESARRVARDYIPEWGREKSTMVTYEGIAGVSASSSWAAVGSAIGVRPQYHAFAAFDGDVTTSWRPQPGQRVEGQWLQIEFDQPRRVPSVKISFDGSGGALPTRVSVNAGGEREAELTYLTNLEVKLPGVHATRTVRITIEQILQSNPYGIPGVAEIEIPGVRGERVLALPEAPATNRPATVVFSAAPTVPACFFYEERPRCSPTVGRDSEDADIIDRSASLPAAGFYEPKVWTRPRAGFWLNAVLDRETAAENPDGPGATATSSTDVVEDPAARPGSVLDGDPRTYWMPASTDRNPMLRLAWSTPRTVSGIRLRLDERVAATRPGAIRVVGNGGTAWGFLNGDGVMLFEPMETDNLSIFFMDTPQIRSFDPYTVVTEFLPIAVGEVDLLPGEANRPVHLDTRVAWDCGSGPTLQIGDQSILTRLTATRRDLLEMRETPAEVCDDEGVLPMSLPAGPLRVVATPSGNAAAARIALEPVGTVARPTSTPVTVDAWSVTERRLSVEARPADRVLALRENTNPGWRARLGDTTLQPVVVDGWQQGWVIPAGVAGTIVVEFVPDQIYRAGLVGGAALLLLILAMALLPARQRGSHAAPPPHAWRGRGYVMPFAAGAVAMVVLAGYIGAAVVIVALVTAAYRVNVRPRASGWPTKTLEMWLPAALLLFGGWLSLTTEDSHRAAVPQLAGILAVAFLWLWASGPHVRLRPAAPEVAAPVLDRALDQVVADGGQDQTAGHRDQEQRKAVLPKQRTVHVRGQVDDDHVPQEQAERHGPDPVKDGVVEHALEGRGGAERGR
jgi:arabinofuranan 3-O-arabinosyltransferase